MDFMMPPDILHPAVKATRFGMARPMEPSVIGMAGRARRAKLFRSAADGSFRWPNLLTNAECWSWAGARLASLWNVETGAREAVFPELQNYRGIFAADLSPDDQYLAYATRDFQLKLWNIVQGREQWSIRVHVGS